MKTAKTNLDYTRVESPIAGRVGRSEVTPGALVTSYQTFMTTVQQLDPIYVDVKQTSGEMLRLKHDIASGKIQTKDGALEVSLLMEDGTVYPQTGKLTFTGEEVDEGTGMINLRAIFPNPNGDLLPGMFVRAQLVEGARPNSVVISQRCVMRDPKGVAYVYVVTPDNKVERRDIVANRTSGTYWIVESGLKQGEKVIIEGLQKVSVGATVQIANANDKTSDANATQAVAK